MIVSEFLGHRREVGYVIYVPVDVPEQRIYKIRAAVARRTAAAVFGIVRQTVYLNKKLRKAAKSDGQQIFEKNVFPKVFNDAAQASYMESTETYTKLFEDSAKYHAIMSALARELYREMRNGQEG